MLFFISLTKAVSGVAAFSGGNGASHGNTAGIKASWKQYAKRGFGDPKAKAYFAKTAHNSGHEFVMLSLTKSLGKSSIGQFDITLKNRIKAFAEGKQ